MPPGERPTSQRDVQTGGASKDRSRTAGTEEETHLGRIALEWELLRPEQLDACLREQKEAAVRGQKLELGRLLVDRGWLKVEDLARVLQEQRKRIEGVPDLPRYEIRERVGEGATAVVYRAWDRELRRPVALKILKAVAGMSPVARQRFQREAKTAAGIAHPNVVTVHDAGEKDGFLYLVMEFVEGRALSDLLRERRIPQKDLLGLLEKVARGMEVAHRQGVVHRDLKPPNILVTAAGEPKIADFGLAHLAGAGTELTRTGATLGTPLYMAPEQVDARAKEISPRTDVYALGVMLYEAVTGNLPHLGDSIMEIYGKITREEPLPPRRVNSKISRDLETIVTKALEKNPARRYPDAGALADDLRRALNGEPVLARPVSPIARLGRAVVQKRRVLVPAALLAGALLTAGLWAVVVKRGNATRLRTALDAAAKAEAARNFENARDDYRSALAVEPGHSGALEGYLRADQELRRLTKEQADAVRRTEEELRIAKALTEGLVLHWTFDEGKGSLAVDSSGKGNHGTFVRPPTWVPGKVGTAMRFEGGPKDGVDSPALTLGRTFSISLWAMIVEPSNNMNAVLSNTTGGAGTDGYKLCVNSFQSSDRKILFETGNGQDGATSFSAPGAFTPDVWHHVAIVVDEPGRLATLYLDGRNVTEGNLAATRFKGDGPLHLGGMADGGLPLRGLVDDLRIYSRLLDLSEIRALVAMGK